MIFPTSRIDAAIPEKVDPEQQRSRGALRSCYSLGELGQEAAKCFERQRTRPLIMGLGQRTRPLIMGLGLFEDLLRSNKKGRGGGGGVEGDWWRQEERPLQLPELNHFFFFLFLCMNSFFFWCMNGLLINHHAAIISVLKWRISTGFSQSWREGFKTFNIVHKVNAGLASPLIISSLKYVKA